MVVAPETLGVDFVNIFGARGAGGEPAIFTNHLEAAYRGTVTWRLGQPGDNRLAGQFSCGYLPRRQLLQPVQPVDY